MSKKIIFFWVGTSNPFNSIFIQIEYLSEIFSGKFNFEAQILHPKIDNIHKKLDDICRSRQILFWHYGGFDPYLFGLKNKANIIFVYHNITPAKFLWQSQPLVALRSILGRLQMQLMDKSQRWITMSHFNWDELHRLGFSSISICPNIIKLSNCETIKKTSHISLLYVGRIAPHKNCIALLKQIEKVANFMTEPIEVIIVGTSKRGCSYGKKFEKKISEVLKHRLLKVNWMKNINAYELNNIYKQSWLYVSMSLHEGFGVPACESIANGTPALYLECGGQESVLDNHGMVGLNSKCDFSMFIINLLSSKNLRDDLLLMQQQVVKRYISPEVDEVIQKTYGNDGEILLDESFHI